MDKNEALEILYGEEARDLTPEGYLEAISAVRSSDPNLAKRVEVAIKPILKAEYFTRRQIPWQESSLGTAYRVALLSENPHFQRDIKTVRRVFEIPDGQVRFSQEDQVWADLAQSALRLKKGVIRRVADKKLARRWIRQHRLATKGQGPDRFASGLTEDALRAAQDSAGLDLSVIVEPGWLQSMPVPHPRCYPDNVLPLHRAVARLLERHRLPQHVCDSIMVCVLTARKRDLRNLNANNVSLIHGPGEFDVLQPTQSFTLVVEGVDEFTSVEDWTRIWQDRVRPQQQLLWEERGQRPQGRRGPDLERLRRAIPIYKAWLGTGDDGLRSVERALGHLQSDGTPWEEERDIETARRVVNALHELLRPN